MLAGTGIFALNNVYVAVLKSGGDNPFFMKQIFALTSVLAIFLLYKAYEAGEIRSDLISGIKLILVSWIPFILVALAYVLLAKMVNKG